MRIHNTPRFIQAHYDYRNMGPDESVEIIRGRFPDGTESDFRVVIKSADGRQSAYRFIRETLAHVEAI